MPSNLFIVGLGIGTVFFGLICIIALCYVMSALCRNRTAPVADRAAADAVPAAVESIPNRQAMIAAVSAAVAEELGADLSAIRILSVKRV